MHGPVIEAEIALRLARDVSAGEAAGLQPDALDKLDALIDAMAVSIEVVDSRWSDGGQAPALLRLADQQSHGALALGSWGPYRRRDWSTQRCRVKLGDETELEFQGSHSLGDPAWLLPAWLRHVTRHGETARAGTVVTTGTWSGLIPIGQAGQVRLEFEGIGEASLCIPGELYRLGGR